MTPKEAYEKFMSTEAVDLGASDGYRFRLEMRGDHGYFVIDDGKTEMALDGLAIPALRRATEFVFAILAEGDPNDVSASATGFAMMRQLARRKKNET